MAEIGSAGSMKRLNNHNYSTWSTCLESYLQGHDLWEIVDGNESTPPTEQDVAALKRWKIKAGKAMFAIKTTIEEDMLEHIRYATTPKEVWDILASKFSRKNDVRLQLLENELMSTMQNDMSINDYFTKIKSLCRKISELEPASKISEEKMRRKIIHGLRPEYRGFITAVQG
ncbi:uncharacterized protein [Rutidosis leptorrhynchoides]|uniref:uncharacterized protein n=1 Tax=Rutidosis leptorrhynchoides TaxID=125765 RepID=UPI003A9A1EDD